MNLAAEGLIGIFLPKLGGTYQSMTRNTDAREHGNIKTMQNYVRRLAVKKDNLRDPFVTRLRK